MAENDLYQLNVHMKVGDSICQFGMGYRMGDGTYGVRTGLAVCAKFVADFLPDLLDAISVDCEVDQIAFLPQGITTELAGLANLNNAVGTVIGDPIPANMAALIHLPTVAPNSKHNGRIYIPGIIEDAIAAGLIQAPNLALVQAFATQLFVPIVPDSPEDSDFSPVVISRFVDGVKRVPPVAYDIKLPIAKNEPRQQQKRMTTRVGLS